MLSFYLGIWPISGSSVIVYFSTTTFGSCCGRKIIKDTAGEIGQIPEQSKIHLHYPKTAMT